MPLSPLYAGTPVVNQKGQPEQVLRLFSEAVAKLPIIIGSGSPEGIVDAQPSRLYMDMTGISGAILYIKRDANIAGNTKNGWILV